MDHDERTRREFLTTSGSAMGGAWLLRFAPLIAATQACASDAMQSGLPFMTFTEREGADFDAFGARIVPTDDTPGAREAGIPCIEPYTKEWTRINNKNRPKGCR